MQKVAVIGLSCLFPGAETPDQFIKNLLDQKDMTSKPTDKQMGADPGLFYSPKKGETDKYYSVRGGYIQDFRFDAEGYELPADLLTQLDDIYQWSLYVSREALKDSGYFESEKVLDKCGVILGNLSFPTKSSNRLFLPIYHQTVEQSVNELLNTKDFKLSDNPPQDTAWFYNSRISGFPVAIIAKSLALSGINLALDAACASSLYSVKLACDYLNTGKADMMLAGAVSAGDPFFVNQGFSTFTAYPEHNNSCPLDNSSGGLVSGEGAGMFVLKRYEDALKDKDKIHAVIIGIGLSNDGRGRSVLSPNAKGQVLAYERAYENNPVKPEQISYIECHATGTPVGDVVELESLDTFFGKHNAAPNIGSVKANFGHLLTAAGMASMIKVILSMTNGEIPGTINLTDPVSSQNNVISTDQVVAENKPWPENNPVKHAAVNAFGFGGTNAHLIFEQESSKELEKSRKATALKKKTKKSATSPMSIVGMDAFFGKSKNLEAFDHSIYAKEQHFIPLPPKRWKGIESKPSLLKKYGFEDGQAPIGAYIKDFALDVLKYRIPPNEVEAMIPQQLLMLDVADNAIRDAEIKEDSNVGVLIAMEADKSLHQFRGRIDLPRKTGEALNRSNHQLPAEKADELKDTLKQAIRSPVKVNEFTSFIGNIMANRISAQWNFSGPSFTVSSEENSVFKALEIAQMMLQSGEVDAMVVGGVDMSGNVEDVLIRNQLMTAVNSGKNSLGYDAETDGWMIGEGAGAVVLKLSEKAKKQRDRCYAQIDALSIKRGGNSDDIKKTCKRAFKTAGINPADIGYLEISGTGEHEKTEIKGLIESYKSAPGLNCAIGSVTANIGHTFAASGIAGLIKTALCLYRRYIPAVPKWSHPEAPKQWKKSPFYVATESRSWFLPDGAEKRYAAINGTGMDGTFAHLILSEDTTPKKRRSTYLKQVPFYLFPVTANDQATLLNELETLHQQIKSSPDLYKTACCQYNEIKRKKDYKYTIVILGENREKILTEIESALPGVTAAFEQEKEWHSPTGSYFTSNPLAEKGKLSFVYPGAFNSYLGMGRDTFQMFPELYDLIPTYTTHAPHMLRDTLINPRSLEAFSDTRLTDLQAELEENAIGTFESGINTAILNTALMRGAFSIQPDTVFGYSMGEVSMMFSLGIWKSTDKMSEILHTHPLFQERLAGPMNTAREAWGLPPAKKNEKKSIWDCYTVSISASDIKKALKKEKHVYLIIINSPNEVIIAGERNACKKVVSSLDCRSVQTPMSDTIHSDIVKAEYDNITHLHHSPISHVPDITFFSAANYGPTDLTSDIIADNIANIYCKTIDFPKLVKRLYKDSSRIFLELGPKSNCSKWISDILVDKEHLAVSISRKGAEDHTSILRALAKLLSHGVQMDLTSIYKEERLAVSSKKSMDRSITLGGQQISTSILTEENRKRFSQTPAQVPPQKEPDTRPALAAVAREIPAPIKPLEFQSTAQYEAAIPGLVDQMQYEIDNHRTVFSQNHSSFLETRKASLLQLREMIKLQMMIRADAPISVQTPPEEKQFAGDAYLHPDPLKRHEQSGAIWDEKDLLEFAGGNIATVFGKEYEIIDSYKYRVRLPLPPYLLVNRVTKINAKRGEFKPSTLTTEYDISKDAWYCVDGQIPWAIASEAGQCDLLLISYLGIDFSSKGDRYYRLTDYTMTFMDELPKAGDVLRYDIHIDSFMKSGEALFFDFGYDCYVKDKLVYKMTGGRAGFSSDAELAKGKGIFLSKMEEKVRAETPKQYFTPLLQCDKISFNRNDLLNITRGNLISCFGPQYDQQGKNPSLRFAAEEIMMLDRIVSIDTTGGPWGLGEIVAQKDLAPDHWYFPCHFKDDNVLAGTLVTEGCVQLLGFYMLYLGLQVNTQDARFQPVKNHPYGIRARGQILPTDTQYSYKMEIVKIGLEPRPYARANFYIILEGKIVVDFKDLGIELVEKSLSDPAYRELPASTAISSQKPLFDSNDITEFAVGSLTKCFGPEYAFYEDKKGPRQPNGDLQLISRVLELKGTRHNFKEISEIVAEYDVPADAWYFQQNSYPVVPYSIIMEIALQPCGFLSTYMGATLVYPELELCFRNNASDATLHHNIDIRGKTITAKAKMTSVAKAAETVVLYFEYELICDNTTFYTGTTQFGYYTPKALSMQRGLDRGEKLPAWFESEKIALSSAFELDLKSPEIWKKFYQGDSQKPYYRLPNGQLNFLDKAHVFENGGKYSKGYIYTCKKVDSTDWFYPCHFHKDPVMPGSLGVEAILQSMKIFCLQQDLGKDLKSPFFTNMPGLTKWKYRGQINPDNETMDIEIHIKEINTSQRQIIITADASLWKNKLRIYEITDAAIALIGEQ